MDVRSAASVDLDGISAIYDEQVATSVSTFDLEPRPRSVWQSRLSSSEPGNRFLVAVDETGVLGFASSSAYRAKPAYARTRELSVYVAEAARSRGVARRLYDELLPAVRADGVHLLVAVIALPNPASHALHAAYGFAQVGVLPQVGWKLDRWVDTAIFTLLLTPDA